jgi:hypothetical protein
VSRNSLKGKPVGITRGRLEEMREQDVERGATLILALVFMAVTGLIVLALLSWSQNGLRNVAAFQQNRTLNYAANSAMETAIASVRYSPTACPSSVVVPNPNPAYNMKMDIWCQQQQPGEQPTAQSRVVTFTECWDNAVQAGNCSSASPFLTAVVSFDDYSDKIAGGQELAYPSGTLCSISTSCGAAESIDSWVFN